DCKSAASSFGGSNPSLPTLPKPNHNRGAAFFYPPSAISSFPMPETADTAPPPLKKSGENKRKQKTYPYLCT
ncbi:hypothetical protein, partial [Prevotella corporis]|uniref:hypothetical protein n=1 Tax=Prevotella corporis TaxID=28128 RepID=UPI0023F3CD87